MVKQMSQIITLDDCKIVYDTVGDVRNRPLLMIHGWLSYRGVWQQTIEAFKDDYYCVAVDLLGFGDSDKPPDADYGIEAQGRRVLQLVDELGLDRFSLIGHSMGGQIGLCLAAMLASERIEKLVNVAGVVSGRLMPTVERVNYPFTRVAKTVPQLYSLWHYLFRYDWFVREVFKTWFYKIETVPLEKWVRDRDMAFQRSVYHSAYESGQAIHNLDLKDQLGKIVAPTLTIFGRQDEVVPISDGYIAAERIEDSRFVLLDECGHFPMYEKPAAYLQELRKFLVNAKG
jgi:pimeloyl-ACP methyl ester carboxylesterase